ncbi:MAG: 2-phospho-L-lactate transferase [Betaproteobacteria bacterium]
MIVAFAGGVGGARLAVGLAAVLPPRELTIVVNTGDDFQHLGVTICPDLDTVMYTLAGINNRVAGWGRQDESWHFMETLGALGGENWFQLGDRDLAVHVLRTVALARGMPLSRITRQLAARLGVHHPILPMSETPVRTRIVTGRGELDFQEYFVRLKCRPRVRGFRYAGRRSAVAPDALRKLMGGGRVRAVVLCPSNPYVSIAPILAVPEIAKWVRRRAFPVVGVSPIVGGAAIKGPAAKMMRELRETASAFGIARHYGALVDGWIIDSRDAHLESRIKRLGKKTRVTDTIMSNRAKSIALAMKAIAFAQALAQ